MMLSVDRQPMGGGRRIGNARLHRLSAATGLRFVDDPEPDCLEANAG
ncbi:MAG: hypothetical protein U0360_03565 [Dehalococcoidia bacterium]